MIILDIDDDDDYFDIDDDDDFIAFDLRRSTCVNRDIDRATIFTTPACA